MNELRLFFGLGLEPAVRAAIADGVTPLREQARQRKLRVSWVPASNYHVTMKFLGGVPEERVNELVAAAEELTRATSPFSLEATGWGAFPKDNFARILWAGIREETGSLAELALRLDVLMERFGFAREGRPFHPHVTIGKIRGGASIGKFLTESPRTSFGTWCSRSLTLYESRPAPSGMAYVPIHELAFGQVGG